MFAAIGALVPALSNATSVLISGHVTDAATSQPIANAAVNIWESFPDPYFDQNTTTDANGYYQMDVPTGNVHWTVSANEYVTQNQQVLSVTTGPVTQDFAMVGAGSVSGIIRAATSGNPALANATVSLLDANSKSTIAQTSSAGDGSYTFQGLAPGVYGVCVIDPTDIYIDSCYDAIDIGADGAINLTTIDLTSGNSFTGIDLSLHVGASLSGILTDRYFGTPIANAQIGLTLYSSSQNQVAVTTVTTDASGGYSLQGLATGAYYLEAGQFLQPGLSNSVYSYQLYGGGECDPSCPFAGATQIQVPAAGASGMNFSLFPGYIVTGRVTDASSGRGIPGVVINVCDNLNLMIYGISGTATTDANGDYAVGHSSGAYTYIAAIDAPGYLGEIWPSTFTNSSDGCIGSEKSAAQTLSFTAPDEVLSGINFSLQSGAAISGTVTASDLPGKPIAASLNLYSVNGQNVQWIATVHSDTDGNYTTPGIATGNYYIAAYFDNRADCQMYSAATCGSWDPTSPLSFSFATATAIQLTANQLQTGVNLQLKGDIFHGSFGD